MNFWLSKWTGSEWWTRDELKIAQKYCHVLSAGLRCRGICSILLQPFRWRCVECVIHHERDVCEEQQYIYLARTSNNRVIMACELYCCLLPQSEALHTCRSGFSDRNKVVTRMWRSCCVKPSQKERAIGELRCKKEGMLLQPFRWRCVEYVIHHERDVCEEQQYIYVARTSNNRVTMACDLYCCLLPQCEALRTCRSGFLIATRWCCDQDYVVDRAKHVIALRHMLLVIRIIKRTNMRNKQCIHTAGHHWRAGGQTHRNYRVQEGTKTCSCTKEMPILFSHPNAVERFNDIELRKDRFMGYYHL